MEMSAEPPRELFPLLRRARAFSPLVVVLAVLPTALAVLYRSLDAEGALWALRSLDVLTAPTLEEAIAPGLADDTIPLQRQPPLGAWLTAGFRSIMGPGWPVSAVLVSWLAAAGVVGMGYALWRELTGSRVALLATLLLAGHAQLLRLAQSPAPHALGVFFAVVAFWGFLSHMRETRGPASLHLLTGGVALGLCLLSGGPVAIAVVAVLLIYVLELHGENISARRRRPTERRRVWVGWPALKAMLVLGLTGFAVGGWWELMMISREGDHFVQAWLTGIDPNLDPGVHRYSFDFSRARLQSWLADYSFLAGFVLVGFWRAVRGLRRPDDERRRQSFLFLLAWTGCGSLMWLLASATATELSGLEPRWQAFLLVPLMGLAAFAIDEISQRRVALPTIAAGMAVTIVVVLWTIAEPDIHGIRRRTELWIVFSLVAAVSAALWWTGRRGRELQLRWLLRVGTAGLVIAASVWGLLSARSATEDDARLMWFMRRLAVAQDVQGYSVLTRGGTAPPQVRFVLKHLWPDAEARIVQNWESNPGQVLSDLPPRTTGHVVVQWGRREVRFQAEPATGYRVVRLTEPFRYQNALVSAFLVTNQPQGELLAVAGQLPRRVESPLGE